MADALTARIQGLQDNLQQSQIVAGASQPMAGKLSPQWLTLPVLWWLLENA